MATSPDPSHFTACLLGEALPEEQAAFRNDLLKDAALQAEACAATHTFQRLATALKQEPAVALTMTQRHTVLAYGTCGMVGAKVHRPGRRVWLGPTLATAGIAAALAWGLYALPGVPGGAPPSRDRTGIPSVAIQPGSLDHPGSLSPAPPRPAMPSGRPAAPGIPDLPPPESPAILKPTGTMAATPPVLEIPPPPSGHRAAPLEPWAPPSRLLPGGTGPGESLANPAPTER